MLAKLQHSHTETGAETEIAGMTEHPFQRTHTLGTDGWKEWGLAQGLRAK